MFDEKKRPEVGFSDMDKYEFGVFEVDNKLTNGYQLYIPYGIHCDFFNAIQHSIRSLYHEIEKIEHYIKTIDESLTSGKIDKETYSKLKDQYEFNTNSFNKDIAILEKILPIVHEI